MLIDKISFDGISNMPSEVIEVTGKDYDRYSFSFIYRKNNYSGYVMVNIGESLSTENIKFNTLSKRGTVGSLTSKFTYDIYKELISFYEKVK